MVAVKDFIEHVSTKPWSDYSESDYTLQQWHDACLIHLHDGPDYTKADCKLPVKTPDGVVNQNGVYAAAAALAGARAPLKAPQEAKTKAAKMLVSMYKQMDKEPPESLMGMMSHSVIDNFLSHYGGIENIGALYPEAKSPPSWTDIENSLISRINGINRNPEYVGKDLNKNGALQKRYDADVTRAVNDCLVSYSILPMNKIDDNAFMFTFDRKTQRFFRTSVVVAHKDGGVKCPNFSVNLDENGFIVGVKALVPKEKDILRQSDVAEFIEHYGIKGQKWGIRNRRKSPKFGPSKDAKRALAAKKKAKNSSVNALTNKELKDLTTRMELERKYHKGLPESKVKKGHDRVKMLLAAGTTISSIIAFSKSPAGQHISKMLNKDKVSGKHFPKPPVKRFGKHGIRA